MPLDLLAANTQKKLQSKSASNQGSKTTKTKVAQLKKQKTYLWETSLTATLDKLQKRKNNKGFDIMPKFKNKKVYPKVVPIDLVKERILQRYGVAVNENKKGAAFKELTRFVEYLKLVDSNTLKSGVGVRGWGHVFTFNLVV